MKYYIREVIRREVINRFGKIGFPRYIEYFKTNDESFLKEMNYRKKNRFDECDADERFDDISENHLYAEKITSGRCRRRWR